MALTSREANSGILPGVDQVVGDFYKSQTGLMLPQYYRLANSDKGMDSVTHGSNEGLRVSEWARDSYMLKQFFGEVSANLEVINTSLKIGRAHV